MHQVHKEQGFSLLELTIVLGLASLLIAIGAGVQQHLLAEAEAKQFIKQFEQDLLFLQQYNQFDHSAKLYLEKDRYEIYSARYEKNILVHPIPDHISIRSFTHSGSFSFSKFGSIRSAGSFKISTPTGTEMLTFPLGKARGYYEEGI
ncbi:type II secretion system protein [Terribacillus halophilus]|jgi:competence protein ComGD|uniref:type II secretion system protein n=1 Tax=Terribacillus halophilus TaxID=361279 RepID=UPI0009876857|nr:type II secretion system protein [Terribacillus halophilus]